MIVNNNTNILFLLVYLYIKYDKTIYKNINNNILDIFELFKSTASTFDPKIYFLSLFFL